MGLVALLQSRRLLIGAIVLFFAAAGVVLALVLPDKYEARTVVVPRSVITEQPNMSSLQALGSSLSGLISLDMGGMLRNPSHMFRPIMTSRAFCVAVLGREFTAADGQSMTILDAMVPAEGDSARRWWRGIEELQEQAPLARFDSKNQMTTLRTVVGDPVLAAALAGAMADELDLALRRLQAAQDKGRADLIGQRLAGNAERLEQAEENLRAFREQNRHRSNSPQLLLREGRLEREVELEQRIFVTLRSQQEMAQVNENHQRAEILIIDPAMVPVLPVSPKPGRIVAGSVALGLVVALVLVLIVNQWRLMNSRRRIEPEAG